jgi:hypothetical protein
LPRADAVVDDVRLVVNAGTAPIAGQVVDARGRPVANALVTPAPRAPIDCRSYQARELQRTGHDGRWRFADLPEGARVTVAAATCDGSWAELRDVLAGSEDVTLTLAPPTSSSAAPAATTR